MWIIVASGLTTQTKISIHDKVAKVQTIAAQIPAFFLIPFHEGVYCLYRASTTITIAYQPKKSS